MQFWAHITPSSEFWRVVHIALEYPLSVHWVGAEEQFLVPQYPSVPVHWLPKFARPAKLFALSPNLTFIMSREGKFAFVATFVNISSPWSGEAILLIIDTFRSVSDVLS